MSKKPYIYEKQEWLEFFQRKDWNDPSINPDDLAEYSEFQRPYDTDDKSDYPGWEWAWPDINLPGIPPIVYPDPLENNPCSIDENCVWAGINGITEFKCGNCYPYSQAHVWYGCDVAPWWAAYGSWTLETNLSTGNCWLLFSGPIMATVCCDDDALGSFQITYQGPLDCQGSMGVQVTCLDCCVEFTVTGDETVNDNTTWTGTISPACPDATCEVTSNSGCTGFTCSINDAGSEVSVSVPNDACGTFTVTVTEPCEVFEASASVRINNTGGSQPTASWQEIDRCELAGAETCGVSGYSCRNGAGINGNCISGEDEGAIKYVWSRECCWTNKAAQPCGSDCSTCPVQLCTCPPCETCTGLCSTTCSCFGSGSHWKSVIRQEWKCEC